jgi:hypothetical protein
MPVSDTFPYIEGKDGTESEQHIRLKGMAVYWLLTRGFDLEDIEEEHPVHGPNSGRGSTGFSDIYAENGTATVHVECEVGQVSFSQAAKWARKQGDAVFFFTEDGIHRYHKKVVEAEPRQLNPRDETLEHEIPTLTKISELPMLDLSAYKTD